MAADVRWRNEPKRPCDRFARAVTIPPKIGGFSPQVTASGPYALVLRRFALALVLGALGNSGSTAAEPGDEQFALAAEHYSHERWQQACEAFDSLLAAHPDHARASQARFFYGEALAQLNRHDLARAQFAEMLRRDPDSRYARQALFRGGEAAYLGGDTAAAKGDLEAFHKRYPRDELNAFALPYLASLELQAGNATAAARLFADALEQFRIGPLVEDCRLGLARAQEAGGQLERARLAYREIAETQSPHAAEAALRWGMLENATGEFAAALEVLARVETMSPPEPLGDRCRLSRAYALYKLGRYAECEPLLEGLRRHPSLGHEAQYWLGMSLAARRQWAAAAEAFAEGAKRDPQHRLAAALAFHGADALLQDEKLDRAGDSFDAALARWPDGQWADDCLFGKLRVAVARDDHERCIRLADELAAKFPESDLRTACDLAKGRALISLGQYAQAAEVLERGVATSQKKNAPGHEHLADLQSALAMCYAKLGRWSDAERLSAAPRQGAAPGPAAAETRCQVAEAAYAAQKFDVARDLFARLVADRISPEVTRHGLSGLAWCEFKSKRWEAAAEAFGALAQEFPEDPAAAEAMLMQANALEHLDRLEPALASYRKVIDRDASSDRAAEAMWRAALLHEKLGQLDSAQELYDRLIAGHAEFPELDGVLYRQAWLVRQKGKQGADELFTRLRREFPRSRYTADATLRLADSALAKRDLDEAGKLLGEIESSGPSDELLQEAWHLQGRVAMAGEQWDVADRTFGFLIERFPQGAWAKSASYLRAEANYRQGTFELAAERFAELAAANANSKDSLIAAAELRRAQALAQMSRWTEVVEVANAISGRFENFDRQPEVDYLIGRALAAQANFSEAREAYARVLRSPRGAQSEIAAMAQWMIGESYFHQENYEAALAEYARLDDRYPFAKWQSAGLLQAAKCQEYLGKWQVAVELYARLLKTYPESEFCAEAQRRLAAAQERLAGGTAKLK